MNTSTLLRIGSILLLLSVVAEIGFAAGTPAGTAITNQATVSYVAGSNTRTATSNTVVLYVAHKVVGVFVPGSRAEGGVDNQTVYYAVQFSNTGNRADNFNISFASTDPDFVVAMIDDANGNGLYDAGESVITTTGGMPADATKRMLVRVAIAANQPDNIPATITATLKSTAADASPIVVANPGAEFQFVLTYTVRKPVITFTSAQSDVSSEASRIPGVNVTYTMSLDNTSASASGIVGPATVTFVLDNHFHYVSSTLGGVLSGADGTTGNGGTVTWTFAAAQLAASEPALSFTVVVQPEQVTSNGTGVPAGTVVYAMNPTQSTPTRVQYNDGQNTYTLDNANTHSFTVGKASGVVIAQVTPDGTGQPDETVEYAYTLKNTGNATDGFDLAQANGGGSLDVAHIFSATSGGAAITALPAIPQGNTVTFYVRVTIPSAAMDGQTIIRNLTATTQTASPIPPTGGSTSSTDGVITTVAAATVTIAVSGGESSIVGGTDLNGKVVPGTVMSWTVTITNSGTAAASSVSASNLIAHQTTNTIVPASLSIDADGNGTFELAGLSIPYTGSGITASEAGGILTVNFATIPGSGAVRRYQYQVAVQ